MVGGQAFTNIYTIGCAPPPMHNLNFSIGVPCRPFHAQTKTTDQVSCPPVPSAHSQVDPAPAGFKGSRPLTTSSHCSLDRPPASSTRVYWGSTGRSSLAPALHRTSSHSPSRPARRSSAELHPHRLAHPHSQAARRPISSRAVKINKREYKSTKETKKEYAENCVLSMRFP